MPNIFVINARNEKEPFSVQKVYNSAKNAGAENRMAKEIAGTIEKEIYPEIKTSEIFKRIKQLLKQESPKAAIRFNLKNGIKRLGPAGFPFEKFVAEIFQEKGFKVKINQMISGFCLSDYEIDFVAKKDNLVYVGECKYRNLSGERIDSKDILMNHARFLDIKRGNYAKKGETLKSILVTNVKFTSRSKEYAECNDLELLGWKYPKGGGLESEIEGKKLYPITILPSLNKNLKDVFVSQRIMLTKEILYLNPILFSKKFNVSARNVSAVVEEAKKLHS